MSEPANKPLHDWVRASLDTYRPDYSPDDWQRLRRTLRRRRWQRWSMLISGLVLIGIASWLISRLATEPAMGKRAVLVTRSRRNSVRKAISAHSSLRSDKAINQVSVRKHNFSRKPSYDRPEDSSLGIALSLIPPIATIKSIHSELSQVISRQPIAFSPEEVAMTQQVLTHTIGSDSTSYQVLTRNIRLWPNAVIVCDFTTSMYPYSTQLVAWLNQHAYQPSILGMVFFTDCDSLGQQTRPGGPPGQMYVTRDRNPARVLPTLLAATRNTVRNQDDAENDVEALLFAQKQFPKATHLILLADNISRVKDLALIEQIKKPVHVILCGTTGGDSTIAYQPDFFKIASRTHGSLHTLEDDITPTNLSNTTTLRVGERYFRYLPRKHQFKLTPFTHRPRRIIKLIWF